MRTHFRTCTVFPVKNLDRTFLNQLCYCIAFCFFAKSESVPFSVSVLLFTFFCHYYFSQVSFHDDNFGEAKSSAWSSPGAAAAGSSVVASR